MSYSEVADSLRAAYALSARTRDAGSKGDWKLAERPPFLARLEPGSRLLEIGAGTGHDSVFFRDNGLDVVTTDLTPEMVECCIEKGLDAHVMDFLHLDFPDGSFDAVWSMNCLLHVPNADLPDVLREVARVLKPGGLFFLGVYGGGAEVGEGIAEDDWHNPKRFFSWRTDEQIQGFARESFEIVDFHTIGDAFRRFQSLTLQKPA